MRICVIVDDYLPDSIKVGAKMMHELACEFVSQGHQVTVFTPLPTLETRTRIDTLDGVTVCRFRSGEIKNVGKIKRAINETLLSHIAWKNYKSYFREHPHDLIVYYSPTIFWGGLVARLKAFWHAPAYLILRDLFPQWAIDQGLIREGSLIEKYFRYFEKKNYAAANTIGLMSERNLEFFRQSYHGNAKLEVLYNWASNQPVKSSGKYRKRYGLENKVVFFYGGNMGHAQDMMNLVRLARNMRDTPEAQFVFVGAGDEVPLIEKAVEEEGLNNILLLPPVSQEEFKEMLAEFDIGLFTLHKEHKTHNFPGKLLGYMVQSMPILGSVNQGNDLKDIIEEAKAGYVTVNGNDIQLLENAKRLMDVTVRKKLGQNAKKLLDEYFSVSAATQQILRGF